MVRTDRHAYIRYRDQSEELYEMKSDPRQQTNLAESPQQAAMLKSLRGTLEKHLKNQKAFSTRQEP